MAKGVHSKRRKRNQSIKRKILDESKINKLIQQTIRDMESCPSRNF